MSCDTHTERQAEVQAALAAQASSLRRYLELRLPPRFRSLISADDVMQEVWMEALVRLPGEPPMHPDHFEAWLRTVAKQRLSAALRHLKRQKRGGGVNVVQEADKRASSFIALYELCAPDLVTPSRRLSDVETQDAIRMAMSSLSPEHRGVIRRFHLQGQTAAQIAEELESSPRAVYSLLNRARENLRSHLVQVGEALSSRWITHRQLDLADQREPGRASDGKASAHD